MGGGGGEGPQKEEDDGGTWKECGTQGLSLGQTRERRHRRGGRSWERGSHRREPQLAFFPIKME